MGRNSFAWDSSSCFRDSPSAVRHLYYEVPTRSQSFPPRPAGSPASLFRGPRRGPHEAAQSHGLSIPVPIFTVSPRLPRVARVEQLEDAGHLAPPLDASGLASCVVKAERCRRGLDHATSTTGTPPRTPRGNVAIRNLVKALVERHGGDVRLPVKPQRHHPVRSRCDSHHLVRCAWSVAPNSGPRTGSRGGRIVNRSFRHGGTMSKFHLRSTITIIPVSSFGGSVRRQRLYVSVVVHEVGRARQAGCCRPPTFPCRLRPRPAAAAADYGTIPPKAANEAFVIRWYFGRNCEWSAEPDR